MVMNVSLALITPAVTPIASEAPMVVMVVVVGAIGVIAVANIDLSLALVADVGAMSAAAYYDARAPEVTAGPVVRVGVTHCERELVLCCGVLSSFSVK